MLNIVCLNSNINKSKRVACSHQTFQLNPVLKTISFKKPGLTGALKNNTCCMIQVSGDAGGWTGHSQGAGQEQLKRLMDRPALSDSDWVRNDKVMPTFNPKPSNWLFSTALLWRFLAGVWVSSIFDIVNTSCNFQQNRSNEVVMDLNGCCYIT